MCKKLTVVDQEYIRNIYEFPAISIYVPVKLHTHISSLEFLFSGNSIALQVIVTDLT